MLNNKQVELYMKYRQEGKTQVTAAAKCGFSERTARKIDKQTHCSFQPGKRQWRSRKDPLEGVWEEELVPLLEKEPRIQAKTLFQHLLQKYPGKFSDSIMRTLFRRRQLWKAMNGPGKDVIFCQDHHPGKQGISDFTVADKLGVTIEGIPFNHLLYHFRLSFSGWSYAKVIMGGESYPALAAGLQTALRLLGGAPETHRTDSLSAAYKNLSAEEQEDFTHRYKDLCHYYHMRPTRNNKGVSHENGSIEAPNRHLKDRIEQRLILRGSKDFKDVAAYQSFIDGIVEESNRHRQELTTEELKTLRPIPKGACQDFDQVAIRVSTQSTINVKNIIYSVPSRLVGMRIKVHLYDDRLELYLGMTRIEILPRKRHIKGGPRHQIDYRHHIEALARKPGAFRNARFKEHFFPKPIYKKTWELLDQSLDERKAVREYLSILKLSAKAEDQVNKCLTQLIEEQKTITAKGIANQLGITIQAKHIEIPRVELNSYNQLLRRSA